MSDFVFLLLDLFANPFPSRGPDIGIRMLLLVGGSTMHWGTLFFRFLLSMRDA